MIKERQRPPGTEKIIVEILNMINGGMEVAGGVAAAQATMIEQKTMGGTILQGDAFMNRTFSLNRTPLRSVVVWNM